MTKKTLMIATVILVAAIALVPTALAASPSKVQYKTGAVLMAKTHKTHVVKAKPVVVKATKPVKLSTTRTTGTLPFTGMNLAYIAAFGVVILAGGVLLRNVGRRHSGE